MDSTQSENKNRFQTGANFRKVDTRSPHELLRAAFDLHQAGELKQAQEAYRNVLRLDPENSNALHLLGISYLQLDHPKMAIELICQAIELCPTVADFYVNLSAAYRATGQFDDALRTVEDGMRYDRESEKLMLSHAETLKFSGRRSEANEVYSQIIDLYPENFSALFEVGMFWLASGEPDKAIDYLKAALKLNDSLLCVHNGLAQAFVAQKNYAKAREHYSIGLRIDPHNSVVINGLAIVASNMGDDAAAFEWFEHATQILPNHPDGFTNLGQVLNKRGERKRALECSQRAVELAPDIPLYLNNLGSIYFDLEEWGEAKQLFEKSVAIDPNHSLALTNLANIARREKDFKSAAQFYQRALEINPHDVKLAANAATFFRETGNFAAAEILFQTVLKQSPDDAHALLQLIHLRLLSCQWSELDEMIDRFKKLTVETARSVPPMALMAIEHSPIALRKYSRCWTQSVAKGLEETKKQVEFKFRPRVRDKIRIGYISADFCQHPVSQLAVEMIEKHDREKFSVYGYSIGVEDDSALGKRIRNAFDQTTNLQPLAHHRAAQVIYDDEIDILIDLTGHTKNSRLQILSLRPAPIQIGYLGFPGTWGAEFIDYTIADRFVMNSELREYFDEHVVLMPHCYQVNPQWQRAECDRPSRKDEGLPETGVIYCCFNNSNKVTPEVFNRWMEILRRVPDSILWFRDYNSMQKENLAKEAHRLGIDPDRLIFAKRTQSLEQHYARLSLADLFLDTWPFNAHTTASDAIRAGVPLLTLAGSTFASRVAGSLMATMELTEMITESAEDYVELACALAADSHRLEEIKDRLKANLITTPLFDSEQFTENFESALTEIHRRSMEGEAVADLIIEAEKTKRTRDRED